MRKVVILSVILVLALATTSLAGPAAIGPRFNYMGYSSQYSTGLVDADTLVCVFNPNSVAVTVTVHIFNKYGGVEAEDMPLMDGGVPISSIPPMGMGWFTIAQTITAYRNAHLPEPIPLGYEPMKYPFIIEWTRPVVAPYRGLVAEVKQILYQTQVDPGDWKNPVVIKDWAETALNKGKGRYGGGVCYSN